MAHSSCVSGDNPALKQAVACAYRGLRMHPLEPRSKKPDLRGWQYLATTEESTIRAWAQQFPQANWGLVAGVESGVFVLNMNRRHGGEAAWQALTAQCGPWPTTWQVCTADGCHLYFQHPGGQIIAGNLAPGLQVLGDGDNVVAPGSSHRNGPAYVWMEGCDPASVPLATPPIFLWDLLCDRALWIPFPRPTASRRTHQRASQYPWEKSSQIEEGKLTCTRGGAGKALPLQWPLERTTVVALLSRPHMVQRLLPVVGLEAAVVPGQNVCCVLHAETVPSAAILPPPGLGG